MSDYINLLGAEDVRIAANTMASAADTMRQAANSIDDSLQRQRMFLDEWMGRFENAVKEMRESPNADLRQDADSAASNVK